MATITDFKEWTFGIDLEDYNEIYCAFKAVQELEEWGGFNCSKKQGKDDNKYFLKCDRSDDILMLASDKARSFFMAYLEETYAGDMRMEGWYYFKHAMEKND